MVGRRKKEAFQTLKGRHKKRIDNCSTRFLSQGGKEVFIKAILQAILTYTMACCLLPNSLCDDLENIIAKYWWQKGHGKRGIHWCTWKNLCFLKENGGLGFRNLSQFNVALLAKQGWNLIHYPNSLLARVLKAKYYPYSTFLEAQLGTLPSLTWKSIWAAKGLLQQGLSWQISKGNKVSIWNDRRVQEMESLERHNRSDSMQLEFVLDLIDSMTRKWKEELINNTFHPEVARTILQIPLSESVHEDFQVGRANQQRNTQSVVPINYYKLLI
ncbi:hypothetical protein PVK06_005024 [Gossypium arboreum]|uniref:Reverse transcriptase n=1 Tax=Gossypium arboreum TaxID=29729 RepID=A0ABR0QUG6_GOSAR|nr:hypothetical protein PVK06_005024 [Gossypium arboreum]